MLSFRAVTQAQHRFLHWSTACRQWSAGLRRVTFFQDMKILKFQDIFQDIKPNKHADKVPLKQSIWLTNLETATAAMFFHSVILVFLSVHLLTGAFSCCNFYVYVVIFFSFVIVICILFMHVCCVFLNKAWVSKTYLKPVIKVRCLFCTFSSVTVRVRPSVFRVHSWVWGSHGQGRPLPEADINAMFLNVTQLVDLCHSCERLS